MTDVSRIADGTMFKIVVPVLQTILSAGAIGAFVYVVGSLSALQTQLGVYQTNSALMAQRVDSLERSRDTQEKMIDYLRTATQEQKFQIGSLNEALKNLVLNGRPK